MMSVDSQSRSLTRGWRSTVGKKIVVALTGAIGIGYVIAHVLGNLLVFQGAETINAYTALLKSNLGLLWPARSILILAVIMHIVAAYQLARISLRSRPVGYKRWRAIESDLASLMMRWTGPLVGLFIVYHLLHLTIGTVHPAFDERNVYHNIISGFQVWHVSVIYIIAMLALSLHLYRGYDTRRRGLQFNSCSGFAGLPIMNGLAR